MLLARGTRCCAPASRRGARAFTAAARLARRAATPACSARRRSASPASGSPSSTSTPRRSRGSRRRSRRLDDRVLRSRLQARLAVELYYAPDRTRSEALSAEAVATARGAGDPSALASALNARHVALWRPDRVEERLATAADMIAAARETGERHAELQASNWRVTDLFELGDMPACREEIAAPRAARRRVAPPGFQWYTPLWAAIEALLAGASRGRAAGRRGRRRACARATATPSCSPRCSSSRPVERGEFDEVDMAFIEDKIANSAAGPAYASCTPGCSPRGERPSVRARRSTP